MTAAFGISLLYLTLGIILLILGLIILKENFRQRINRIIGMMKETLYTTISSNP